MEGKKYRALGRNCQAVSELMGAVLMISIVVLALSSVALTVFSDSGEMDPVHTPHTNLEENLDRPKDIIRISHNGGEAIDLEDIIIILKVDGKDVEFNMSDPGVTILDSEGNISSDDVFTLDDCIMVNTSSKIEISNAEAIDLYFVHTESSQVIQKTMLWKDSGSLPYWITPYPYGSVYDSDKNEWLDQELVDKIGDHYYTDNFPKGTYIYENFTFGSLDDLDISEDATFSKVILKIVYRIHDQSAKLTMEVNNGSPAVMYELTKKGNEVLDEIPDDEFTVEEFDITEHVKNATDLENLVIKISTTPNAADQAGKEGWIDFIGIHLEY